MSRTGFKNNPGRKASLTCIISRLVEVFTYNISGWSKPYCTVKPLKPKPAAGRGLPLGSIWFPQTTVQAATVYTKIYSRARRKSPVTSINLRRFGI